MTQQATRTPLLSFEGWQMARHTPNIADTFKLMELTPTLFQPDTHPVPVSFLPLLAVFFLPLPVFARVPPMFHPCSTHVPPVFHPCSTHADRVESPVKEVTR
jgi:hypothetical protein